MGKQKAYGGGHGAITFKNVCCAFSVYPLEIKCDHSRKYRFDPHVTALKHEHSKPPNGNLHLTSRGVFSNPTENSNVLRATGRVAVRVLDILLVYPSSSDNCLSFYWNLGLRMLFLLLSIKVR